MKIVVLTVALLVAGTSAVPTRTSLSKNIAEATKSGETRIITDQIISAIEDISELIRLAGLDPLNVDHFTLDYVTPVPSVFGWKSYLSGLHCSGLSNIVINRMTFNLFTLRLIMDIELPSIIFNIVDSEVDLYLLDFIFNNRFSGSVLIEKRCSDYSWHNYMSTSLVSVDVENARFNGDIRVSIGLSGISLRSMDLELGFGRIATALNLRMQGVDFSDGLNDLLNNKIPASLSTHKDDINELITLVAWDLVEDLLNSL